MGKVFAAVFAGFMFALIGAFVVALGAKASGMAAIILVGLWCVAFAIALTAPSGAKAWRRLLICCAIASFLLPLATVVFTGTHVADVTAAGGEHSGAATAGALIGGGLVTGFMGVLGFFLGAIFLVIGLLVGRDPKVIYVQAPPSPNV
jgi:hypothetical protein